MISAVTEKGRLFQGMTDTRPGPRQLCCCSTLVLPQCFCTSDMQPASRPAGRCSQLLSPVNDWGTNALKVFACSRYGNWSKHRGWSWQLCLQTAFAGLVLTRLLFGFWPLRSLLGTELLCCVGRTGNPGPGEKHRTNVQGSRKLQNSGSEHSTTWHFLRK